VNNEKNFSESLFNTLKYRPQWPKSAFGSSAAARGWLEKFVQRYNEEHKHNKLNFVSLGQRHVLQDSAI
jgi:putative transposase